MLHCVFVLLLIVVYAWFRSYCLLLFVLFGCVLFGGIYVVSWIGLLIGLRLMFVGGLLFVWIRSFRVAYLWLFCVLWVCLVGLCCLLLLSSCMSSLVLLGLVMCFLV